MASGNLGRGDLYGLHNVFTKMAAGKVSDNMGGLLLEGTATVLILLFIIRERITTGGFGPVSARGVVFSVLAGLCVGAGTVLYFYIFRMAGELSVAGPIVLAGGIAIMAVAGLTFFGEPLTAWKILGLVFSRYGDMASQRFRGFMSPKEPGRYGQPPDEEPFVQTSRVPLRQGPAHPCAGARCTQVTPSTGR